MAQDNSLLTYQELHQRIAGKAMQSLLDEAARHSIAAQLPLAPAQVASVLFTLARAAAPLRILEIGTGFGYSTLLLALAGVEAQIITIENNVECSQVAQSFFERADVAARIRLLVGDAMPLLPTLSGTFDFLFIDAAKEEYAHYLQLLWSRLHPGTLLIADDVFFTGEMPGRCLPEPVREQIAHELTHFRGLLSRQPGFVTTFLPLACGVSVTLVTAPLSL